MSKIPRMLHKMLGSMSHLMTEDPLGIWGLGYLLPVYYKHVAPLGLSEPMNQYFYVSCYQQLQNSTIVL